MTQHISTCGDCAKVNRIRGSRLYGTCDGRNVVLTKPACDLFAPLYNIPPESNCDSGGTPALFSGQHMHRRRAAARPRRKA